VAGRQDGYFSHSRLSCFETCPRQYRYRYLDRLPRRGVGIEAHVGTSVHAALEMLHRRRTEQGQPSLAEVQAAFESAWSGVRTAELRIVRQGFAVEDYLALGRHCVETYVRGLEPFEAGTEVEVEKRVEVTLDPAGRRRLVGFIDRVERTPAGEVVVHDYKTSATLPRPEELDRDRQLTLYEIALRRLRPGLSRVRQIWHYLAFGRSFDRVREPDQLERVRRESLAVIERIDVERAYEARPSPLCHWCDYNDVCPEGRSYCAERPAPGLPATEGDASPVASPDSAAARSASPGEAASPARNADAAPAASPRSRKRMPRL
jgi:putative RecB family exonuclease